MYNKHRVPWKRGPKLRYSVYKAENRLDGEDDYEGWARHIAEKFGYNLADFYHDDPASKNFWQETYNKISLFRLTEAGFYDEQAGAGAET